MPFASMDLLEECTLTMDTSGELRPAKSVRRMDFLDTQYIRLTYDGVLPEYTSLQVALEYTEDGGETWQPLMDAGPALESGNTDPVLSMWSDVQFMNGKGDIKIRVVVSGAADIQFTLYYVQMHFR